LAGEQLGVFGVQAFFEFESSGVLEFEYAVVLRQQQFLIYGIRRVLMGTQMTRILLFYTDFFKSVFFPAEF
jgi:hypothetical protein